MAECTYDLDHSWPAEHASWNSGAMDSFVSTHTSTHYEGALGINTMGYYKEADIPFYYDLAKNFTDLRQLFLLGPRPHSPQSAHADDRNDRPSWSGRRSDPRRPTPSRRRFNGRARGRPCPRFFRTAMSAGRVYNPYGANYAPNAPYFFSKNMLLYFKQYKDPSSPLYQNAFGYYGPNVVGGLTGGVGPNNFAADVANGTLPSGVVDPSARGIRRAPPGPTRPRRVVHPAGSQHADIQSRGMGQHRAVHHVRRERWLLRPCPATHPARAGPPGST